MGTAASRPALSAEASVPAAAPIDVSSKRITRLSTGPGASAFTRMPTGTSLAKLRISPCTACLEAAYTAVEGEPLSEARDDVNSTLPPFPYTSICRSAAAAHRKAPRT